MTDQTLSKKSPILLISDLDDTIKITDTQNKLITIFRGLFKSSAFTGMAELYHELVSCDPESKFSVISSSPHAIQEKIRKFLRKNSFPSASLTLRDWIRQPSIVRYKLKALTFAIEGCSLPVILVGDDTEHDPEIFAKIKEHYPERVLAVYIRKVKARDLPSGISGFYTAFDIACHEHAAGRLNSEQVLRVGEALLTGKKLSWLIPKFSVKPPKSFSPFTVPAEQPIMELWTKIHKLIQSIPRRKL